MTTTLARRAARLAVWAAFLGALTLTISAAYIRAASTGHVYDEQHVPAMPVALVLGAQVHDDGTPSGFLVARLDIAQRLYAAGKVRVLLVSGDNSRPDYDEPDVMRQYLIAHGVPAAKVVADYAGFDTYDSCHRAIAIFGVHRLTVVTQSYHIDRAVALCREAGIDTVGVGDDTARQFATYWYRANVREQGAYVKALVDVVSGRSPVFLGRRETTVDTALARGAQ